LGIIKVKAGMPVITFWRKARETHLAGVLYIRELFGRKPETRISLAFYRLEVLAISFGHSST